MEEILKLPEKDRSWRDTTVREILKTRQKHTTEMAEGSLFCIWCFILRVFDDINSVFGFSGRGRFVVSDAELASRAKRKANPISSSSTGTDSGSVGEKR